MIITRADQARDLGLLLAIKVSIAPPAEVYALLAPILAERTPFRLLDLIGEGLSNCPGTKMDIFLDEIASHATIGGWTVIASALRSSLSQEMQKVINLTYGFIIRADTWYACDCFGERVLGQALVDEFDTALKVFSAWRIDKNRWVRRSVGVAGHLWAKRSSGAMDLAPQTVELLKFYEPLLAEQQIDAAKGVGWALKTLGRYYPEALFNFLHEYGGRTISPIILRKALKFLPENLRTMYKREA